MNAYFKCPQSKYTVLSSGGTVQTDIQPLHAPSSPLFINCEWRQWGYSRKMLIHVVPTFCKTMQTEVGRVQLPLGCDSNVSCHWSSYSNLCITLTHQASCQRPAEGDTMLHCLGDNQMFASYLEWTTIPCRKSSLLSTCVFIPKTPPDRQANWTAVSVAHVLFSHTFISHILSGNTDSVPAV